MIEDKPLLNLSSYITEEPELDADEQELESNLVEGVFEWRKTDLLQNLSKPNFKLIWLTLKDEILTLGFRKQQLFIEQVLDVISDVYDFTFPINIDFVNNEDLQQFYSFLEFLEFDNVHILTEVWKFLRWQLLETDITAYCKTNQEKVLFEIHEYLETHPQPRLIDIFLRSYYRILEWFVEQTNRNKPLIFLDLLVVKHPEIFRKENLK